MDTAYRKEYKYIIPIICFMKLRGRLSVYMKPDENMSDGYYKVRSLYFDTTNDYDLYSSVFGFMEKSKIRLRIYPNKMDDVRLELKQKNGYDGMKTIVNITRDEADLLIKSRYKFLLNKNDESALKLYNHLSSNAYAPRTIVEYKRTAYKHPVSDARITFDYNVRISQNYNTFFDTHFSGMPAIEHTEGILEVKYNDILLRPIKDILKEIDDLNIASSKYVESRLLL